MANFEPGVARITSSLSSPPSGTIRKIVISVESGPKDVELQHRQHRQRRQRRQQPDDQQLFVKDRRNPFS